MPYYQPGKLVLAAIILLLALFVWGLFLAPVSCAQVPCCSANICAAQHHHSLPEAPQPNKSPESFFVTPGKVFWIGTAALAGSTIADAITTRRLLDSGGVELDSIFGRHPSPARQAGINAALFFGQVIAFRFTEKSQYRAVRLAGRVLLAYQVADYGRTAACNAQINPLTRKGCKPY